MDKAHVSLFLQDDFWSVQKKKQWNNITAFTEWIRDLITFPCDKNSKVSQFLLPIIYKYKYEVKYRLTLILKYNGIKFGSFPIIPSVID